MFAERNRSNGEQTTNHYLETIYIGGGTPTSAAQLDLLITGIHELLPTQTTKEFTVEANPGDLTEDKLLVLKNLGIDRLSMGCRLLITAC